MQEQVQDNDAGRGPRTRVKRSVMDSARKLLEEGGYSSFTVDALARESSVSKATIYRWWRNRADVAMDVLLEAAGTGVPYVLDDSSPIANLRHHIGIAAGFLSGPDGTMLAGIVGDAQHDGELASVFRSKYLARRRSLIIGLMSDAMAASELPAAVDVEAMADMLIGPMYYRLMLGHAAIDHAYADEIFESVIAAPPQKSPKLRTK